METNTQTVGEFDPTLEPGNKTPNVSETSKTSEAAKVDAPEKKEVVAKPAAAPIKNADSNIREKSLGANIRDVNYGGTSLTEGQLEVKRILDGQPKVSFYIPLDEGEKKGAYRSVTINGYRCEIKKGTMVSVPEAIFNILKDSYQLESEALHDNPTNLELADSEKRKALGL